MPINQADFSAQSGDYSIIKNTITYDDALQFCSIYEAISAHAIATQSQLLDYISNSTCVNLSDLSLPIVAISTLKAIGVIISNDGVHIGLTLLGYGFYQFIQV
jgi:hypothetical protein